MSTNSVNINPVKLYHRKAAGLAGQLEQLRSGKRQEILLLFEADSRIFRQMDLDIVVVIPE